MLMHQGLGLEAFDNLPRRKAVHALYECCCSVAWASRVADGRSHRSRAHLFSASDAELADRLDNHDRTERTLMRDELAQVNLIRLDRLLGPEGGWPQY
ncbi:OHCU decarboxylase [Rhodococcus fascians]|nr:OHCU decarboxylase [Rhodococcus fascians]